MALAVKYRIIANPTSGMLSMGQRRRLLDGAAKILHARVYGLDTRSAEELADCARQHAARCDVLVVAGGDGTFSLVTNAVDLSTAVLAFLPFGTGNALSHALKYRGRLTTIAKRIREGTIHSCDLIDCCSRKKAFMASLGIDGTIIRRYEFYHSQGYHGLNAYLRAGIRAFRGEYRPTGGIIAVDGNTIEIARLLSLVVVKQAYFGMGLKAVPQARWDDANLHVLVVPARIPLALMALATGFTIGNRVGAYMRGKQLIVRLDDPLTLQMDGELGWTRDRFAFEVLPAAMRLKH
jgi:diacylglycerol kinase family enzyme